MPMPQHNKNARCKNGGNLWVSLGSQFVFAFLGVVFFLAGGIAQAQSEGPITPPPQKPPQLQQAPAARPQQSQPKISVEVKLVYLYVTVRDKHGKIVPTLNQQDFVLEQDGRPQMVTHFIRESDVPLTLGLLVDTSLSQRNVIDDERDASYKFLDQMLRDKDEAFVIHFDRQVELLQDLTASRPKLNAALQELQTPQPQFSNGNNGNSGNNGNDGNGGGGNSTDPDENVPTSTGGSNGRDRAHDSGGGTLLYDAIYLAANDEMKKQPGRKAVFVLSDGVDRGSKETLTAAIEAAQRADTAVYSIYFADHNSDSNNNPFGRHGGWGGRGGGGWPGGGGGWPGGGGGGQRYPQEARVNGKDILKRISTETGGQLFQVSKKLTLDQIFAQVEEGLRGQYALGYT
ncbi:MAG: VWA domain-containing protein, partial [Candidatus Acidiferrales bacterium]